jgi:hypothetical protein
MVKNDKIAIVTQTKYNSVKDTRAKIALRTVAKATGKGLSAFISDGTGGEFREQIISLGATVSDQPSDTTMGADRRRILKLAADSLPDDGIVFWTEPEKDTLIQDIPLLVRPILEHRIDLVIPARSRAGWDTYPPEQVDIERFGNRAFQAFTGVEADIWFGPFAANKRALQHFLDYTGEYGDKWDSIHIPRVSIFATGLAVMSIFSPNFRYPAEQCKEEEGNPTLILKRLNQMNNLIPALYKECIKFGFIDPK